MNKKEEILADLVRAYKNGYSPTREEFVKRGSTTRRDIDKHWGNFGRLKQAAQNIISDTLQGMDEKLSVEKLVLPTVETIKDSGFETLNSTLSAYNIKTLEELIEYHQVDTAKWEAKKFSSTIWRGDVGVKGEFALKVDENTVKSLLETFTAQATDYAPKKFTYKKPKENGKLYVLNIQDTHLGKRADSSETGWGAYNIEIAKKAYTDAVQQLMNSVTANDIETVMLIVGSDFIHFESEAVVSTALTRLESDSSWYTVYNEGCKLITDIVAALAETFKVEVVVVTGNHARLTEYALGSYVKAFFRNHENVNVDNTPLSRKYFGFKKNLLGFIHGDKIKLQDLPLVMMRENQATVSNYEQFTWLSGHWHQDKLLDIKGVRVLVCPALCSPDKYHSSNNYVGNIQSAQGLLFAEWGLQQIIYAKGFSS